MKITKPKCPKKYKQCGCKSLPEDLRKTYHTAKPWKVFCGKDERGFYMVIYSEEKR